MSQPQQAQKRKETTLEDWTRSDEYHNSFLLSHDDALESALKKCDERGLPQIGVSPAQGKFLQLLARSVSAKRILEVGTLGGYSTIWLAKALPAGGELITLELEPEHAKVAEENIASAGLSDRVKVLVGPAAKTLETLTPEPTPFEFVFIDADKPSNLTYLNHAKRLTRSGAVIIIDNVVRYTRVADPNYTDDNVEGVRTLLKALRDDPEVDATTIATVGEKGLDGFLYAIRK